MVIDGYSKDKKMKQIKFLVTCLFILCSWTGNALTPVSIKKETSSYIIDIRYPQGFTESQVNIAIKDFVEFTKKSFYAGLAEDEENTQNVPGKSGLNVDYSIPFNKNDALSVRFNVSIYHRGAAHPNNTVAVLNFVQGKQVELANLFVSGADFLKPIAQRCTQTILNKKISDPKWIKEGTKPMIENYQTWHFTDKGLAIIFNSYQVAAYVYGEQTVSIPLSLISTMIKPEILKLVWKS